MSPEEMAAAAAEAFDEPVEVEDITSDPVGLLIIETLGRLEEFLQANFTLLEGQKGETTFDYDEGPQKYYDFSWACGELEVAEAAFIEMFTRIRSKLPHTDITVEPRLYFFPGTRVNAQHVTQPEVAFALGGRFAIVGFRPGMEAE